MSEHIENCYERWDICCLKKELRIINRIIRDSYWYNPEQERELAKDCRKKIWELEIWSEWKDKNSCISLRAILYRKIKELLNL